ncbi:MAG: hypothetical protein KC503_30870 [Myxococcales bacterium]|nr:hypothetical protein [Myxococcales bacterium]
MDLSEEFGRIIGALNDAHIEYAVISRDALIAMKVWAGRPQDAADVQRLQESDR